MRERESQCQEVRRHMDNKSPLIMGPNLAAALLPGTYLACGRLTAQNKHPVDMIHWYAL